MVCSGCQPRRAGAPWRPRPQKRRKGRPPPARQAAARARRPGRPSPPRPRRTPARAPRRTTGSPGPRPQSSRPPGSAGGVLWARPGCHRRARGPGHSQTRTASQAAARRAPARRRRGILTALAQRGMPAARRGHACIRAGASAPATRAWIRAVHALPRPAKRGAGGQSARPPWPRPRCRAGSRRRLKPRAPPRVSSGRSRGRTSRLWQTGERRARRPRQPGSVASALSCEGWFWVAVLSQTRVPPVRLGRPCKPLYELAQLEWHVFQCSQPPAPLFLRT